MSLVGTNTTKVNVLFSHGAETYLHTESADVPNAWGPVDSGVDYWLYFDINLRTGLRTFGVTTIQPVYSANQPSSPVNGMHWFNTASRKMYAYVTSSFIEVLRVFAAKLNTTTFTPLGSGVTGLPFAGTQVGLTASGKAGRILVDDEGKPIRRSNGAFFTTESLFFTNGSAISSNRLETSVNVATAGANLAQYTVVKFSDFGVVVPAEYNDLETSLVVMTLDDLTSGEVGEVCSNGHIHNIDWNWSTVGAELWIDHEGLLTENNQHELDAITYPTNKAAVARVATKQSVLFKPK